MELRLTPGDFADAVLAAARIISARPAFPALGGILIEADLAAATFSAFDYERSFTCVVAAEVDTVERALVSGRLLAAIAKVLPKSKPVHLKASGSQLTIEAGPANFTLPLLSVEDYPILPTLGEPSGTIAGDVLAEAVGRVAVAASIDDTDALSMLTGIHIASDGDELTFTTTDRFRLATYTVKWAPAGGPEVQTLIGAKDLAAFVMSIDTARDVSIHVDDSLFGITGPRMSSSVRVIDKEFPKYKSLLPAEHDSVASFEVGPMSAALKRTSVTTTDKFNHVTVELTEDGALLRSSALEVGSTTELVPADLLGKPITMRFNANYFGQALAAIGSSHASIGLTLPTRPAMLYPAPWPANAPLSALDTDYRHLMMPVRGEN